MFGFLTQRWRFGNFGVWVPTLSFREFLAVEVLFLGCNQHVDVVNTDFLDVLSIDVALQVVLVRLAITIPAIIVVAVRIWRDNSSLTAFRVVATHICMDVEVFETVNLIVEFDVTDCRLALGSVILEFEQCHRVLRSVGVGGVNPVRVGVAGSYRVLPVTAKFLDVGINRLSWVGIDGCTKHCTIGIAVVCIHVFCTQVDVQVVVEQRRREVESSSEALEARSLNDTLLVGVTQAHTIRHVLCCTGDAHLMVGADSSAINLVLPVGVGSAKTITFLTENVLHVVAIFIAGHHVVLLAHLAKRQIAVVGNLWLRTLTALLGGDNNHTVRCTRTVDSGCRSILQHGECFDIGRVHHRETVGKTFHAVVIHCKTIDNVKRVVVGSKRRTTTDTHC